MTQQTLDGGYIVGGYTYSYGAGESDIYVVKLNDNGNIEWTRTIGGAQVDEANSIEQTKDGGYIVAGGTSSFGAGENDSYVVKLDGAGNIQWTRTIGGQNSDYANAVQQTKDGGYVVAGVWNSNPSTLVGNMYVVKLDGMGNLQWTRTVGGSSDFASSIQQTTDGGYIIAGYTNSFGAGEWNVYVVKLNGNGKMQWNRTFGGDGDDIANTVMQTEDGGYIVAGITDSFNKDDDIFLVKTDVNGKLNCSSGCKVGRGGKVGSGGSVTSRNEGK